MASRRWGLALLWLVPVAACGGAAPYAPVLHAPHADVAALRPADLATATGTRTVQVRACAPKATKLLQKLPESLGAIPACSGALEGLRAFIAAECAGGEEAVGELAVRFERCVAATKSSNKLNAGDSFSLLAAIGGGFAGLSTTVERAEPTSVVRPSGGAGVPFESMLINAVTDFVVARAKAEVLGWVADEFGNRLCDERDDAGVNVGSYFEHTCRLFRKDGQITATVEDFGRSLQVAVQRDLRASIGRLVNGAVAHLDPRLRVVAAFVAELIQTKQLAKAVDHVDREVACGTDQAVCFMKLGLHTLALFEQRSFDPAKPDELLKALDAAIAKSSDKELQNRWDEWRAKLSTPEELFAKAKTAATELRNALANPASDTLVAADTAVVSFLLAVEGQSPLGEADRQKLRAAAAKVTLTREWLAVALAAYQVIDGIRRGDDPVGMVVAAGRTLPAERVGMSCARSKPDWSRWTR